MNQPPRPKILFIGGHDPSGGAGLQADIETALAHGCRALSLVSCLTQQDSRNVQAIIPQALDNFRAQFDTLIADLQPDVIKIGLLGSAELSDFLAEALPALKVPIVLDPVLRAGGGQALADQALIDSLRERLLPLCTLITPNRAEARRLAQTAVDGDAEKAAEALLQLGAEHVLLTGADEVESGPSANATDPAQVHNQWFSAAGQQHYRYPYLTASYHGSGCTLAAACACQIARQTPLTDALSLAQDFAWASLRMGEQPGQGQHLPWRLPL